MIELYNQDNITYQDDRLFSAVYCDMIYENENLNWLPIWWKKLKYNGIFIVQTDWHTDYLVRSLLEIMADSFFVNHLVWKNEWGNHPKDRFHQCYDDIIIYAKGSNYKFYPDRIQVPKATKTKGLNPSGRETKTATAWIDDICLTTTAKERVKRSDGHLIPYQKPLALFDRIILPFSDENDSVADPFAGSGTVGVWCIRNKRNYVGFEVNNNVFDIATNRINIEGELWAK